MLFLALACVIPDGTLTEGTFVSPTGTLLVAEGATLALDDGQTCVTLPSPLAIEAGRFSWAGTLEESQLWPESQAALVEGEVDGAALDLTVTTDGGTIASDRLTRGGSPTVSCKD